MDGTSNRLIKNVKTWFCHPANPEKKVFVFAEAPHLLKLVRNHFVGTGFLCDDKYININPISDMLLSTNTSDLSISYKITEKHLNVKNVERQNILLATQLLSHAVASCTRRCVQLGKLHNEKTLHSAKFIKTINDWFDLFNSKVPELDSRNRIKAYGLDI